MMIDLDSMLRKVIQDECTDLHLKPGSFPLVRKVKELVPIDDLPVSAEDTEQVLERILPEVKRKVFQETMEMDFAYGISDDFRFRVNAHYHLGEIALSFRLCRSDILSFRRLRLPPVVQKLAELEHGLVLVTGITGSGKSTTLAAMLNHINETRRRHIVTIEDPVEFIHRDKVGLVTQREVGLDTASFLEALKRVLRQDPDVILIGEMRDAETIRTAISAAETGHLVFSTLHVVEANMVIDRILSFFEGGEQNQIRLQLSANLQGVIAQHLLASADHSFILPALEIMIGTPTVRKLIHDGNTRDIRQAIQNGEAGMQTLDQHLLNLARSGIVTVEDALASAHNASALKRNLEGGYAGGDRQAIIHGGGV
jgi:twitching motility protein PilT